MGSVHSNRLAGASGQLAEGTLERFRRQLLRTGNGQLAKAGGASDEPPQGPQNVEGRVLAPPPPPSPPASARAPAPAPAPPPQAVPAPARPQTQPGDAAPNAGWLITLLAGLACLAAFVFGIARRAMRNRPSEWRPS